MNHPIIVIEGPDATGKTTLADHYCEKYGGRKIHLTLRKSMFAYQVGSLWLATKWSKHCPVIIDRHWPSENIYAGAYRGGTLLEEEAEWLARVMSYLGVFYVVALMGSIQRMLQAHRDTFAARKEMYEPSLQYEMVVRGYWDWYYGSHTTAEDIGYCRAHAPMREKHMSCFLYDRDLDGADLPAFTHDVHVLSTAWRKHCMQDKFAARLTTHKKSFLHECGYRS